MKEETFGPEERIFSQDEQDFKLFFVMQGKVEILVNLKDSQNSYRCLGYLKKGQSFGEKSLFSCSSWAVTGRCLENTSIIFMRKEEFLSVIKEFRNDYEVYCMLRDKAIQEMEVLELKCTGCFYKDHEVSDCELLFCKPRKSFLISKYNYYLKQEKRDQSIVRKGRRTQDSWKSNIFARRQLKKLRVSILNKEFNNIIVKLSRKNESLFDVISEDRPELDERFFTAIPEFYYHENEIVIALEEQDLNMESRSGSDIELDREFDELLQDHHHHQNSAGHNQIKIRQTSAIKSQDLILLESVSKSQQYLATQNEDGFFPGPQNGLEKKQSNTCIESPDCSIQCAQNNNIGLGIPSTTNLGSAQNIQIITNSNNFSHNFSNAIVQNSSSAGNHLINTIGGNNITNLLNGESNNNNQSFNSVLIPNIQNANSINNITLNSNLNNYQRQLSTGNYSGPLSCPSAQIHPLSSQLFFPGFPGGENNIPSTQQEFQALQTQQNMQNNQHGYPSLFGGLSRPPNQNKRKGSLPPIQRQNSNDRNLGINPTQITKMLQQIQNSSNTQNTQANLSAIISNNSASEINIPQNPSENGFKQIQLFMSPSSEFQQSKQSNNGTPMNRDQLLGEIENEDSRIKQPGQNQRRPGRQKKKTLISNELHLNQRKSRNYDQEQSPMKRRSKKNVTIFKDSVHLSVMNPMEKSQNKFLHYGSSSLLNHQLTVPQKLNSENQISLGTGNASGNNTYLQEELQAKDLFVLMNFDQMHEYSHYFPNFNYSALRFRNKADQQACQHISKTQHQNYVFKKNYSSIRS